MMMAHGAVHFQTAGEIVFGEGCFMRLGGLAARLGLRRVALVSSPSLVQQGVVAEAMRLLEQEGIKGVLVAQIKTEPALELLETLSAATNAEHPDGIIGIGGGSVLDAAKLLAVRCTTAKPIREMLGIGQVETAGIPTILVPTTSGTGAEVTPNAIVTLPEEKLKVGVVSPYLYPRLAVLDPLLTVSLPPAVTASTGMDAFTHAIESYLSNKANPISDTYALESMRRISRSLEAAYRRGDDLQARTDMLLGSMYGGMALSCSGTAAVHALAYPLGGSFHIPHGTANAMLLPHVMRFNHDAVADRLSDVASAMGLKSDGQAAPNGKAGERVVSALEDWIKSLGIPQELSSFGMERSDLAELALAASRVTRLLNNNPKPMTVADIESIYSRLV
jgi:alcohol dehydrogenase class IV